MKILQLFVFLSIFTLCLTSDTESKSIQGDSKKTVSNKTKIDDRLTKEKEYVMLLAIKYDLTEIICQNIIKDYFKETSKPKKHKPFGDLTIKLLSQKYGVSEQTIASLIIDYKSLQKDCNAAR